MIDTDKYEGHTEGPWWINHKDGDGATSIWNGTIDEADMNHVADVDAHDTDLRLIADAPLLLAEVKQFHNFDEYITMLRNRQIDADDICDVWDEIRKEREE